MTATQLALFGSNDAPRASRRRGLAQRSRHVLHAAAVAEATATKDRLGCDLRSGWASFWASLSPEQRQELRSRVAA